jgi:DNA-binding GntR family transcriptional regulator
MTVQPRPPKRATAQQLALDHIRDLISRGFLEPEARIRQEQLAAELGTSVVPVREALKILEAEGQVLYEPHRGYQVKRLGAAELVETYRLRELLEDEAVRLGITHLDEPAFDVLEEAMAVMESASARVDLVAMTEANRHFHFAIFTSAQMPRMTDFIRQLWQATDAYRSRYYGEEAHRARVNEEHRLIVAALRKGDADRAVALHRTHRDAAVKSLQRMLSATD